MLAALAVVLAVVGVTRTATAADAPFIQIDMGMADPGSYDHAIGGGQWGDGRAGAPGDVGNEFQWADYQCGDIVSFLVLFAEDTTQGDAPVPRTVDLGLAFDAATSGMPGAGYTDIVGVSINDEAGAVSNGDSHVTLLDEQLTDPYQTGGKLTGTVELTGLDPEERIVVRVDVRVTCLAGAERGGILYAQATGASEVAPGQRDLGVGQLRQQLIQVNNGSGDVTPELAVTKTPSPDTITTDDASVDFTVAVSNPSTAMAVGLDGITDDVLGDVTAIGGLVTATDCEVGGPPLLPGDTYACTFTALVHATAAHPHVDTVTVTGGGIEATATATVTRQVSGPVEPPPAEHAQLGLHAQVTPPGPAHRGDTLTVPVTVRNIGQVELTDVHVTEASLALDETLPSLAVGSEQTFTRTYVVTAADVAAGHVTFDPSAVSDQTPTPVTQHLAVDVVAAPLLTLSNQPDRTRAAVADLVTFTLTVSNAGDVDLTNVHVTDALVGIDQTIPLLTVGSSQTLAAGYTVTTADSSAGQVVNPAQATSDQTTQVEATARVDVDPFGATVLDIRTGGSLPTTGGDTGAALWLAAAMATAGAAYLAAGRKPQRSTAGK